MLSIDKQRGDTLIEVLLAIGILTAAIVGGLAIMNRGNAEAYNALERSQVRAEVAGQAEMLHYLRDQYLLARANNQQPVSGTPAGLWEEIRTTYATDEDTPDQGDCSEPRAGSFFINTSGTDLAINAFSYPANEATDAAAVAGNGLWIEAVTPAAYVGAQPAPQYGYIDFYVKACWNPAGGTIKQNLSTVVRLYERD